MIYLRSYAPYRDAGWSMTMSATHAHRRGRDCFHVVIFETLRVPTNPDFSMCVILAAAHRVAMLSPLLPGVYRAYTVRARGASRFPSYRPRSFGRFNHRFRISALACNCSTQMCVFYRDEAWVCSNAPGLRRRDSYRSSFRDWYHSSVPGNGLPYMELAVRWMLATFDSNLCVVMLPGAIIRLLYL